VFKIKTTITDASLHVIGIYSEDNTENYSALSQCNYVWVRLGYRILVQYFSEQVLENPFYIVVT